MSKFLRAKLQSACAKFKHTIKNLLAGSFYSILQSALARAYRQICTIRDLRSLKL